MSQLRHARGGTVALLGFVLVLGPSAGPPASALVRAPAPGTADAHGSVPLAVPCFMGRHTWRDDLAGPPPLCQVGTRAPGAGRV